MSRFIFDNETGKVIKCPTRLNSKQVTPKDEPKKESILDSNLVGVIVCLLIIIITYKALNS
jgi:hypothetical protein